MDCSVLVIPTFAALFSFAEDCPGLHAECTGEAKIEIWVTRARVTYPMSGPGAKRGEARLRGCLLSAVIRVKAGNFFGVVPRLPVLRRSWPLLGSEWPSNRSSASLGEG